MKCKKCGNAIEVRMASRVDATGCNLLESITSVVTVECKECRNKFQLPLSSFEYLLKTDKDK
jgi:hypothetical protein